MKARLQIWHWILFIWAVLLAFRFELIAGLAQLLISFSKLVYDDSSSAFNLLDFSLADGLIAFIVYVLLPIVLLMRIKESSFFKQSLNFSSAALILLAFTFLLSPIITDENPDFQKNLIVTKLLPPLSTIKVVQLGNSKEQQKTEIEKFKVLKSKFIKPAFDDDLIFADSIGAEYGTLFYYQGGRKIYLQSEEGNPAKIKSVYSKSFLLGTDEYGRDIFTRLIYGARISLLVGIGSVLLSLLIGLAAGFIAGLKGGWMDIILSRFTEIFLAFPVVYLIILILALFGNSLLSIIIVLGVTGWMSLFKVVKSEVVALKNKDYIITARLIGLSKTKLLVREILPVILVPVIVNLVFQFSNVILAESALSYLGLGTGGSYPSWGAMIDSGQEYITNAWWLIAFPGAFLIFTLFSANDTGKRLNKIFKPGSES